MRLQLVERLGDRLLRRLRQLLAEPDHRRALLVARLHELRRLGLDPRLRLRDQLLLPLREPNELRLELTLRSLEVVLPAAQPVLDAPFGLGEHGRELLAGGALPLRHLGAALVGDPPLLRGEHRERVRAGALQQQPQLVRARLGLLADDRGHRRLRVGEHGVLRPRARARAAEQVGERDRAEYGDSGDGRED